MSYLTDIKTLDGHDKRRKKNPWIGIVIHHTTVGNRTEISNSLWKRLHKNIAQYLAKKDKRYVSAHYQIGRMGEITQIIDPDRYVAYHAGKSSFWNPIQRKWISGCNDHFIGIELLGDGNKIEYSHEQYESLIELTSFLMNRYPSIIPNCIVGHEMVAPNRKIDPGKLFDWRYYFKHLN